MAVVDRDIVPGGTPETAKVLGLVYTIGVCTVTIVTVIVLGLVMLDALRAGVAQDQRIRQCDRCCSVL